MKTIVYELAGRLEGYKDEPAWEIVEFGFNNKEEKSVCTLTVEQVGDIECKSKAKDLITKVVGYDEKFDVIKVQEIDSGIWLLIVEVRKVEDENK